MENDQVIMLYTTSTLNWKIHTKKELRRDMNRTEQQVERNRIEGVPHPNVFIFIFIL